MHLHEVNQLVWIEGQEVRSGGFVAKTLLGGNTLWTSMDTFGCTTSRLHDQGE